MPKLDEQLLTLEEKLKLLKLRQQRNDARQAALAAQRQRKADLRRQILLGALVMAKLREGALDAQQIRAWLDASLTRNDDRALFDLPALVRGPAAEPESATERHSADERQSEAHTEG